MHVSTYQDRQKNEENQPIKKVTIDKSIT